MASISLRGIDEELAARLKQQASEAGKSVNQFVLDMLRQEAGLTKKKLFTATHYDLDQLFGQWSDVEFHSIQDKIDTERRIDSELWK